jgi:hypothetical protein
MRPHPAKSTSQTYPAAAAIAERDQDQTVEITRNVCLVNQQHLATPGEGFIPVRSDLREKVRQNGASDSHF